MRPAGPTGAAEVRAATADDLAAVAAVARATGQPGRDSAVDPGYAHHLLAAGRLLVAEEPSGLVGFAGTLQVGALRMLTDLFVDPDRQDRGVGARLLAAAWAGAAGRATFASLDPRALGLYARAGLSPRWPLVYLAGPGQAVAAPDGPEPVVVGPDAAAEAERALTGLDRGREYGYWIGHLAGRAVLVCPAGGGGVAAAGVLLPAGPGEPACLRHLVTAPGAEWTALAAVLRWAAAPVTLCLPGPHPGLGHLLGAGFRIEGVDLAMDTGGAVAADGWVVSPAMV